MAKAKNPRSTHRWHVLRAKAIERLPPVCGLCGHPIEMDLPGTHPAGPTVDHIHPIQFGGDPFPGLDGLQLAHRRCNLLAGSRDRARMLRAMRPARHRRGT